MKAIYQEFLSTEIPSRAKELLNEWPWANRDANVASGFTFMDANNPSAAVRVRVYPNELARQNSRHFCIIVDALKGADIPISDIEAALDKWELSADDRANILHDISNADVLERCQQN